MALYNVSRQTRRPNAVQPISIPRIAQYRTSQTYECQLLFRNLSQGQNCSSEKCQYLVSSRGCLADFEVSEAIEYTYVRPIFSDEIIDLRKNQSVCLNPANCDEYKEKDAMILEFEGHYLNYGKLGYYVDLSSNQTQRLLQIQHLKDYRWINEETRAVVYEIFAFDLRTDHVICLSVILESLGGTGFHKQVKLQLLNVNIQLALGVIILFIMIFKSFRIIFEWQLGLSNFFIIFCDIIFVIAVFIMITTRIGLPVISYLNQKYRMAPTMRNFFLIFYLALILCFSMVYHNKITQSHFELQGTFTFLSDYIETDKNYESSYLAFQSDNQNNEEDLEESTENYDLPVTSIMLGFVYLLKIFIFSLLVTNLRQAFKTSLYFEKSGIFTPTQIQIKEYVEEIKQHIIYIHRKTIHSNDRSEEIVAFENKKLIIWFLNRKSNFEEKKKRQLLFSDFNSYCDCSIDCSKQQNCQNISAVHLEFIEIEEIDQMKTFLVSLFKLKPYLITSFAINNLRIVIEFIVQRDSNIMMPFNQNNSPQSNSNKEEINNLEKNIRNRQKKDIFSLLKYMQITGCKVPILLYAFEGSQINTKQLMLMSKQYKLFLFTRKLDKLKLFCRMKNLTPFLKNNLDFQPKQDNEQYTKNSSRQFQ
eukprot:403347058